MVDELWHVASFVVCLNNYVDTILLGTVAKLGVES